MQTVLRRRSTAALAALTLAGLAGPALSQVTSVGLSTVRGVHFGKAALPSSPSREVDLFSYALATGDFDGDGADDLALGVPLADGPLGGEVLDSGLVAVRSGEVGRGLGDAEAGTLSRVQFPGAEEFDDLGAALAACDFDGDGFDDLAMGAPQETLGPTLELSGAVIVVYGSSAGLAVQGFQLLDQDTPGLPGAAEPDQRFGESLACGDFDGDGRDDLAIGSPGKTIGGQFEAGAVFVLPGSATGLDTAASLELDQDQPAVSDVAELRDEFGYSLASGDFDGDGRDDLAVGVPGEELGGATNSGAVHVFLGTSGGLSPGDAVFRDESGVGGLSEAGDNFGFALTSGDFDGDGRDDLVVGHPFEDLLTTGGTIEDCGAVTVLYGAPGGVFDFGRRQFWSQTAVLGPGASEADEWFGYAMAAGDYDGDGRDDLVVGAVGEFVTGPADGAATVFMGSATGLSAARHREIASGLEGWPGNAAEHLRSLSASLAVGDFDGDGHDDLALGAPREDFDGLTDSGAATVVYGSLFADGFETGDSSFWTSTLPLTIPEVPR